MKGASNRKPPRASFGVLVYEKDLGSCIHDHLSLANSGLSLFILVTLLLCFYFYRYFCLGMVDEN